MTYNFTPRTDEQFNQELEERKQEMLIPVGEYDFTVKDCQQVKSKSGNEMFKLMLEVYDHKGRPRVVFDHIILNGNWDFKLKNLCDSLNMSEKYTTGVLENTDFFNKCGFLKINQQNDKLYGWKNVVERYICKVNKDENQEIIDDDLPF